MSELKIALETTTSLQDLSTPEIGRAYVALMSAWDAIHRDRINSEWSRALDLDKPLIKLIITEGGDYYSWIPDPNGVPMTALIDRIEQALGTIYLD